MMSDFVCKRCGHTKPAKEFKTDTRYKRGVTSWCKDCHRERNREWYLANKKKQNKKAVQWRKDNPAKAREISRAFHERNKEARAASHAEWARRNRHKRNAAVAKRNATKLCATPKWVDWEKVRAIYREARRISDFTGIPHHVDHIVPLQGKNVCGLHWELNLQIIPASENCEKFNKWNDEIEEAYRQPDLFVAPPTPPTQEAMDV